eukprot:Skav235760  [mRNA]  locus=scaffold803:448400:453853:+ [translate_table: standard]
MSEFRRIPLVTLGPYKGLPLYEPALQSLEVGKRVTVKSEIVIFNQGQHVCRSAVGRSLFILEGNVPEGTKEVSVLYGLIGRDARGIIVQLDQFSHVLPLKPCSAESIYQLKEVCTGIGGLGIGAEASGFKTKACVEKQERFCEVLKKLVDAQVVEGDMSWLDTVAALHAADPDSSSLGFGFNCQSFSTAGDMRGGADERSMTLPWGLWTAFFLNAAVVTMECVSEAPTYPFVKKSIQQYQEVTGSHLSETIMDLRTLWPSSRRRWWAVLMHPGLGRVHLHPFPSLPRPPVISDVLPEFQCTDETRVQLTLLPEEYAQLNNIGTDYGKCEPDIHATMPTALHSWANQLVPCHCKCRPHGLGLQRLKNRGFFGVLIRYKGVDGQWVYRHPSARETALLTGLPRAMEVHDDARLEVAGVGQLASPLQSAWMFSQIRAHLSGLGVQVAPQESLGEGVAKVCEQLFRLRAQWISEKTIAMEAFEVSIMQLLRPQPSNPGPTVSNGEVKSDHGTSDETDLDLALQAGSQEWEPKELVEEHPTSAKRTHSEVALSDIPGAVPGFGQTLTQEKSDCSSKAASPAKRSSTAASTPASSSLFSASSATAVASLYASVLGPSQSSRTRGTAPIEIDSSEDENSSVHLPTAAEKSSTPWFDPTRGCMVRSIPGKAGTVEESDMRPGDSGFLMATFPGDNEFETEIPNSMISLAKAAKPLAPLVKAKAKAKAQAKGKAKGKAKAKAKASVKAAAKSKAAAKDLYEIADQCIIRLLAKDLAKEDAKEWTSVAAPVLESMVLASGPCANAAISQEELSEGVDLALAVAYSYGEQPTDDQTAEPWLRLCSKCGCVSYLRQGCCLNSLCQLSYMRTSPEELGQRLQSWGKASGEGVAKATPEQLDQARKRRLSEPTYGQRPWKRSKGVRHRNWGASMRAGIHPRTGADLSKPVWYQGAWWLWRRECGWRQCEASEIPQEKAPEETPPWRQDSKANYEAAQKAQALAIERQRKAKAAHEELMAKEHMAVANMGMPTSARPPTAAKTSGSVVYRPPPPRVTPGDVIPLLKEASPAQKAEAYAAMKAVLTKAPVEVPESSGSFDAGTGSFGSVAVKKMPPKVSPKDMTGLMMEAMAKQISMALLPVLFPPKAGPVITMLPPKAKSLSLPAVPPKAVAVSGDTTDEEVGEPQSREP